MLLALGSAVLAFAVLACSAALVEVFRHLAELRIVLNLQDAPTPLRLNSVGRRTEELGLPNELTTEPEAIVVFLSPKCGTCLTIAESFRGGSPATVWFVLPSSPAPATLMDTLADSVERVIIDENDEIANRIGLDITPTVLTTSFGEIMRAQTVSSARQVLTMIPTVLRPGMQPASPQPHAV